LFGSTHFARVTLVETRALPVHAALFEADCLADAVAEKVQLGATDNTFAFDHNVVDTWRMKREFALDTLASNDTPDGEHFARS
jgi:hypothetical protein